MKVVINSEVGGFSLSRAAVMKGRELSGNPEWGGMCIKGDTYSDGGLVEEDYGFIHDIKRNDPILIQVVSCLRKMANGEHANLKVVNIPDDVDWEIHVGDSGAEWIAEKHRTWE